METVLLIAALLAQDPPKVAVEKAGKFSEIVPELERAFGTQIKRAKGIEEKELKVSVRDAGFFEAVDSLCRTHGGVSYFVDGHDESSFRLTPNPWIEYPSAYHGHFKVVVHSLTRTHLKSVEGEEIKVDAHFVLFGPPFVGVDFSSGAKVEWSVGEARDADGKDVTLGGQERLSERISFSGASYYDLNVNTHRLKLRDFDLDRGLSILRGAAVVTTADAQEVTIPVEVGKSVVGPAGTLTVDAVNEYEKGSSWRIAVTYRPKDPNATLRSVLEYRAQCEGEDWSYLSLPDGRLSFEVDASYVDKKPAWIKLRARTGERKITVPFEFKGVVFKKD